MNKLDEAAIEVAKALYGFEKDEDWDFIIPVNRKKCYEIARLFVDVEPSESTVAQRTLEAAWSETNEMFSERYTRQEPSSEANVIASDQGQALRRTIVKCTEAIVAALEGR